MFLLAIGCKGILNFTIYYALAMSEEPIPPPPVTRISHKEIKSGGQKLRKYRYGKHFSSLST
jgi:hypothetical protein